MRILFLSTNPFMPEHFSEQNHTLLELCCRLTELGHDPVVLASKIYHGQKKITVDHGYGFRLFRATDPIESIPALCLTLKPDIAVIVDGHYERLLAICHTLHIPMAVWFFHFEPYYFRDESLDKNLLYLASSHFIAAQLRCLFGVAATVVPPYINKDNYSQVEPGNRVLFVNPVREKGIEIAFELARERPNQTFIFMESWGLSEEWRRICFERAFSCGNIEWIPSTRTMSSVLGRTRLLLVPSFYEEGFCRLVTEAQLGGIPILSSNRGYLPDNVGPGGVVLKFDVSLHDWLHQLDKYLEDENYYQRMSKQAREHAFRDELAGNRIIDHLLLLLASQISGHRLTRTS